MPLGLADRMGRLSPSATMEVRRRAEELRRKGVEVIDLGPGEPDFPVPDVVQEAAVRAIAEGHAPYGPAAGLPELKCAIAARYREDYRAQFTPEEVLVSCGGKMALFSVALAILSPGDEVLVPSPFWVSYPAMAHLCGAKPVFVPTLPQDRFHLKPEAVQEALSPRTKALIVNSPSNPTGALLSPAELESIISLAQKHSFYVIFDECYELIFYEEGPYSAAPYRGENVIIVGSLSKSHAVPGWRLGWALGPEGVIRAATAVQSHSVTHPSTVSQRAALAALTEGRDATAPMRAEYLARRDLVVEGLNAIPGVECLPPEGAFYAFPDVSAFFGGDSLALANYLLEEAHVAAVPGRAFGRDGHLRLSFSCSREELRKGIERLRAALAKIR
ncbi:pyridoxal phosphate-dependent aminotransferase [Candidatus Bipolaricaulota bacterium]|nr:pyridoxal phosphate-dependent aminotransferase [Candidatus Bipolaricaulota bacterium]